jgi:DNA-binding response OmpR family regulator
MPALVLSGDTSSAAEATARSSGIGFLLKPVDPDELLERIRALVG